MDIIGRAPTDPLARDNRLAGTCQQEAGQLHCGPESRAHSAIACSMRENVVARVTGPTGSTRAPCSPTARARRRDRPPCIAGRPAPRPLASRSCRAGSVRRDHAAATPRFSPVRRARAASTRSTCTSPTRSRGRATKLRTGTTIASLWLGEPAERRGHVRGHAAAPRISVRRRRSRGCGQRLHTSAWARRGDGTREQTARHCVRPSFITRSDRDDARPLEHVAIVDAVAALRPRLHRAACDSYRSITHMTLAAAILRRTWDLSPGSCLKDQ